MLFSLSLTGAEASQLGFLLFKHPDRVQTFTLSVGRATVFYPEATADRATASLIVAVDPFARVKGKNKDTQYVSDRPYAASSLLSAAIGNVYRSAMAGRSDVRPDLAARPLPLEIRIPAVPARPTRPDAADGGAALVRRLFEPLGWAVDVRETPLASGLDWGAAPYVDLTLTGDVRLADALSHVYVLLPVLDNAKHYWVDSAEVDKLLRQGDRWLATHPDRDLITRRYLANQRAFVADATARLDALDERPASPQEESDDASVSPLKVQRRDTVLQVLREVGARRVADVGCGAGYYLRSLLDDPGFTEILGVDVSAQALSAAERRLGLDRLSDRQRGRLTLRQSSVTYRDDALDGYDAILLVEVVEHLELDRLPSLEHNVFGSARPGNVVVTTPNAEYNSIYALLPGTFRHRDHRYEWTRSEFSDWAHGVAERRGYTAEIRPVGPVDAAAGPPTQLALFTREEAE